MKIDLDMCGTFKVECNSNYIWVCDYHNTIIHYKDSNGCEWWTEYDSNNNEIHCKYISGYESWTQYDENEIIVHITEINTQFHYYT